MPVASLSKGGVFMQRVSSEKEFDLHNIASHKDIVLTLGKINPDMIYLCTCTIYSRQ